MAARKVRLLLTAAINPAGEATSFLQVPQSTLEVMTNVTGLLIFSSHFLFPCLLFPVGSNIYRSSLLLSVSSISNLLGCFHMFPWVLLGGKGLVGLTLVKTIEGV